MARGPVYNIAVSDKARAVRYMFMADQPVKWHDKERQQIAKEARYWRCKSNQIISKSHKERTPPDWRRDVMTTVGWKLVSEARITASDLKQIPNA